MEILLPISKNTNALLTQRRNRNYDTIDFRIALITGCLFLMALTARTLDMPLCGLFPLGTHFLWHLLIALWLYLMIRLLVVRSPRPHGEGRAFQ